jgi:hypothetical protein
MNRLANWKYHLHFAGERTYYFVGNPSRRAAFTLALVDIDCHGKGTRVDALAFADLLRERWPVLACEVSTNGNGIHAYVLVKKGGRGPAAVNTGLKAFERHLKSLLARSGIAAENVEVKGTCPEISYDAGGRITAMRCGTLAKLPRTLTAEQLENTQTFTVDELVEMDVPQAEKERKPRGLNVGSVSGLLVPEAELKNLPRYERLAKRMTSAQNLPTSGRHVATPADFAIVLMILKALSLNPNADGSMPTARVQKLWEALYDCGDVARPFSYHRFKTARDCLSDRGHLSWTDNAYGPGTACKWDVAPGLLRLLNTQEKKEASFADTTRAPDGPGRRLRPVRQHSGTRGEQ